MSGKEYIKNRNRLFVLEKVVFVSVGLCGAAALMIAFVKYQIQNLPGASAFPLVRVNIPGYISAGVILLVVALVFLSGLLTKNFESQYPEMSHLEEWIDFFGSPDRYPVNANEKIAAAGEAALLLSTFSRSVSMLFRMRDASRSELQGFNRKDPAYVVPMRALVAFEEVADAENRRYLEHWDFFVHEFGVLPHYASQTPEQYRKSFGG